MKINISLTFIASKKDKVKRVKTVNPEDLIKEVYGELRTIIIVCNKDLIKFSCKVAGRDLVKLKSEKQGQLMAILN